MTTGTTLGLVAIAVPCAVSVLEFVATNRIPERHHSHHDTYAMSPAFTRAIVFAVDFMGITGIVLAWLCSVGVFDASAVVVLSFFVSFVVVMSALWLLVRRFKVSLFDDRMIVTPMAGPDRTIYYDDITSLDWSGLRKGSGYRNLAIYEGDRRAVVLPGVLDLEQVLMRIDRYDVLGRPPIG